MLTINLEDPQNINLDVPFDAAGLQVHLDEVELPDDDSLIDCEMDEYSSVLVSYACADASVSLSLEHWEAGVSTSWASTSRSFALSSDVTIVLTATNANGSQTHTLKVKVRPRVEKPAPVWSLRDPTTTAV